MPSSLHFAQFDHAKICLNVFSLLSDLNPSLTMHFLHYILFLCFFMSPVVPALSILLPISLIFSFPLLFSSQGDSEAVLFFLDDRLWQRQKDGQFLHRWCVYYNI